MDPAFLPQVAEALGHATGQTFLPEARVAAGGGCINQAFLLTGRDGRRFFIKHNAASQLPMFEAEADGLAALAATGALTVPAPIAWGVAGGQAWLALEALTLSGSGDAAALGRGLAALHRCTGTRFGWHRDNVIGATPQPNTPRADWIEFWRRERLGHQLALARQDGASRRLLDKGERLMADLPAFFKDYTPVPSLIHGDLWGGNHAYQDGCPVIFDPAVYHGDREADLAMTELFGGYPPRFYQAYREAWPVHPGYSLRRSLYNLYHVLNHHHLFGGGYAAQAEQMMDGLLRAT